MAIPKSGAGYQSNDGNANEVKLSTQAAPQTATDTATLTVDQITGGILQASPTTTAAYTLPICVGTSSVTGLDSLNAHTNSSFDVYINNVTGSGVITMTAGTGWTVTGLATIAATANTSSHWRARKTSDTTWTLYRIG